MQEHYKYINWHLIGLVNYLTLFGRKFPINSRKRCQVRYRLLSVFTGDFKILKTRVEVFRNLVLIILLFDGKNCFTMTVIFDLDYTLLDTDAFKNALCASLGITIEEFNGHSKELFSGPPPRHYDLHDHIRYLVGPNSSSIEALHQACDDEIKKRMDKFLFPDSCKLVDNFINAGWDVHLMTLGSPRFQEWKVAGLHSLNSKFSKIIYVGTKKLDFLYDYFKSEDIVLLVNDNARESLEIVQSLPKLAIALVDGGYCHNVDHGLETFKLAQIDPSQFSSTDLSQ